MDQFTAGEIVTYTWRSHRGRWDSHGRRPDHPGSVLSASVKFLSYKGAQSAVIQVETPLGVQHKPVPLASISKLENA